jgi:hypothetical protein
MPFILFHYSLHNEFLTKGHYTLSILRPHGVFILFFCGRQNKSIMVRRYVSFALNDTISISASLHLFSFLFFFSIGGLGDWPMSEQSTTAFWPFLPPNMWNHDDSTCLVYI